VSDSDVPAIVPAGAAGGGPASPSGSATRAGQGAHPAGRGTVVGSLGATTTERTRRPVVSMATPARGRRRARLVIKHIDPWTVMKVTFVVSVVMLVVIVVAVAIVYAVLGKMGVWDQINNIVNDVSPTTAPKSLHNVLTGSRVVTVAAIVGGINVILMTALATLGAAIYNLISDLVGGFEVTLTDP
jgi:Transmembrane domain of unknown function (DUF3566)